MVETHRGKLTHDGQADPRKTEHEDPQILLHRAQVDAVGTQLQVDENRRTVVKVINLFSSSTT